MSSHLPPALLNQTDEQWLETLITSIDTPVIEDTTFPGFPDNTLQATYVGSSNRKALEEAALFHGYMKQEAARAGNPVIPGSSFLDFGCGWGRFLRFFWKDIAPGNLYGCDTNQMILDTCAELGVPGHLEKIDPLGTLPCADACLDHVMAYSVFTHLPEKVHLHWMRELARVIRPGGVFALTLEPRRFIDFIRDVPEKSDNDWYNLLKMHQPRVPAFYQDFDAGKLVFMPTNPGHEEDYGDAVVPLSFIETHWQPWFEIVSYLDNPEEFWQAVLVVKRTSAAV